MTPDQRSQRARIAALTRWSQEDPKANAKRGQTGLRAKFRREILADDPHLNESELARRVDAAQRAHMQRLAYKSSKARKAM